MTLLITQLFNKLSKTRTHDNVKQELLQLQHYAESRQWPVVEKATFFNFEYCSHFFKNVIFQI